VHLYSIGHPVVGDVHYGDKGVQGLFGRLMLHSRRVTFTAPAGTKVTVDSAIPGTFQQVLDSLTPPAARWPSLYSLRAFGHSKRK
jgi:hypothetical protein